MPFGISTKRIEFLLHRQCALVIGQSLAGMSQFAEGAAQVVQACGKIGMSVGKPRGWIKLFTYRCGAFEKRQRIARPPEGSENVTLIHEGYCDVAVTVRKPGWRVQFLAHRESPLVIRQRLAGLAQDPENKTYVVETSGIFRV